MCEDSPNDGSMRMSPQLVAILVLALVFLVSTTRSINMGAIAFAAAFGVGTLVADMDVDAIFAGFPGDLFVVLVGVNARTSDVASAGVQTKGTVVKAGQPAEYAGHEALTVR